MKKLGKQAGKGGIPKSDTKEMGSVLEPLRRVPLFLVPSSDVSE